MFRYDSDQQITREQFLAENEGYSQFRAFQTEQLYGCNVATSLFYEESPFRPDWLLNDFIQMIHPEMKPSEPLRYYHKLSSH
jgi:iron complex transport system substrate-binding protein